MASSSCMSQLRLDNQTPDGVNRVTPPSWNCLVEGFAPSNPFLFILLEPNQLPSVRFALPCRN